MRTILVPRKSGEFARRRQSDGPKHKRMTWSIFGLTTLTNTCAPGGHSHFLEIPCDYWSWKYLSSVQKSSNSIRRWQWSWTKTGKSLRNRKTVFSYLRLCNSLHSRNCALSRLLTYTSATLCVKHEISQNMPQTSFLPWRTMFDFP